MDNTRKVSSIGDSAFEGCYSLTSVTIGENVNSIGEEVFSNCPMLKDVYCYAEIVPTTNYNNSGWSSIILHVPANALELYKGAYPWSESKEIVAIEDDPTGVQSVIFDDKLYPIYTIDGRQISKPQREQIIIQTINGRNKKVIMKR